MLSARSNNSSRSSGSSGRYRRRAAGSEVDESLFGGSSGGGARPALVKPGRRTITRGEADPAASVVSNSMLQRIRASTIIRTEEEIRAEQEKVRADREAAKKEAKKRKDYMRAKGRAAEKVQHRTDIDVQNDIERKAKLEAAQKQRDENNDGVKALLTLGARAAAFTLRQNQLRDKEERAKEEAEYDRRMDVVMEVDRLRDLQARERVESIKHKKRIDDREVLMQQIAERKQQKIRQQEAVRLEGLAMVEQVRKAREEELQRAKERADVAAEKRIEIARENSKAVERKKDALRAELEADLEVVRYNEQKAERERIREQEEFAREEAKKEQQKKLLDDQERAQQESGEMDELRMKRHMEELERKERQREQADAKWRADQQKLMAQARIDQMRLKEQARAAEVTRQQEEYHNAKVAAREMQMREDAEVVEAHRKRYEHRDLLLQQIADKHANDGWEDEAKRKEGLALRQEFATELAVLEKTRAEIIGEFRKQGVDERFMSEMVRADMRKFQMRV